MPEEKHQPARPAGFANATDQQIRDEAALARINDRGYSNVDVASFPDLQHKGKRLVASYTVSEEEGDRAKFAALLGQSISIQTVAFINASPTKHDRAQLTSTHQGSLDVLSGRDDGAVTLTSLRNGVGFHQDITQKAAQAGITAAGIRRTQQDMAADGEITRPEQETIKGLIDRARHLAGLR